MNNKIINAIIIVAVIVLLAITYIFKNNSKPLKELPYYGEKQTDSTLVSGEYEKKVSYHTIGDFSFTDQEGKTITQKDLDGKIYVADYFFTTCKSICPLMTSQMQRVYDKYKNVDEVCFVSHTVDPET